MIRMNRCFAFLLAVILLFPFAVSFSDADTVQPSDIYEPYFILVNADDPTKALLGLERDADKQVYPASTTKILTCIVALEQANLDDYVSVSAHAVDFGRGNSLMGLAEGDQYTMRDMLYGLMLLSGNDAAIAIAEHIAGSTSAFADLMNAKAREIGMTRSHFVTVHGKHNDDHYTTVRDMALLTAYALKNETFREIVATKEYVATTGPVDLRLLNSNRMLADAEPTEELTDPISCLYPDAIGVKTGDTDPAGKCLIAAAEREDVTLIAVLFGGTLDDPDYDSGMSQNRKDKYNVRRFQDAAKLFDYAFASMQKTVTMGDLIACGLQTEFEIEISNAAEDDSEQGILGVRANVASTDNITLMEPVLEALKANAAEAASPIYTVSYAPIAEGAVVGLVEYSVNGKKLFSYDLVATRSIKEGMTQVNINSSVDQQVNLIEGTVQNPPFSEIGPVTDKDGLSTGMIVCIVLLIVIGVALIFCIFMFILYLRYEAKRRKKRARAAARKRALQEQQEQRYSSRY